MCEIKPTVLQVEAHPYYPENELKEFLAKHDIKIQAWYPLGHGDKNLINEPIFAELAEEDMKRIAEINKNVRYYEQTQDKLDSYASFRPDLDARK